MRSPRWLYLSALAVALLLALHAAADEPELLLLALRVDGEQLSDSLDAAVVDGEVRLPLGELARLLELDAAAIPF
ncbi:MAG: hypothetical protein JOZ54_19140, partial [Acidobacteria bacterium]|nr:hypothetical protein [Acidobacteriota bacterium]